ncbi:MAG: hypothetical protein FIA99_02030 [Ruminiclostridium sp.]|nr:hypothetical protein [Ruminiclostridium sp.]
MNILLSIFTWVLYSSVTASVLAVIILLFKLLLKNRLGVRWHYCVWVLILVRLLIPYAPESTFSVFNLFNFISNISHYSTTSAITSLSDTILLSEMQDNSSILRNASLESIIPSEATPNSDYNASNYLMLAFFVWLLGVVLLGLYTLLITLHFKWKVKRQQVCTDESILNLVSFAKNRVGLTANIITLHTDLVRTPAVFGFIKTKLLLPTGIKNQLTYDELRYIIFHEIAHLKRKDIVVSCIASFLTILHWFNPILWYTFYRMQQDGELACDALALSYIDPVECKKYGQTIIRLLENFSKRTHVYGMAGIIENKSQIKRRLTMISLFKKSSYKWSVISVIVLLIFSSIMLTNATGGTNGENLEAVWQDIKQTYSIDEQEYYRVRTDSELKQFLNGKLKGYTDKDIINQYDKIVNVDHRLKLPEGATEPILLLRNDCREIVFAYKEKDGRNILRIFKRNGDTWDGIGMGSDSWAKKSDNEKMALKEMYNFYLEWDKTMVKAFAVDLNGYRKIETMVGFTKLEYTDLNISDVRRQIPLKYGDIIPSIYLNKSNTQGIAVTQDLNGLYTLYEFEESRDKDSKYAWKIVETKTVQGERKFINENEKKQFIKNPTPNTADEK